MGGWLGRAGGLLQPGRVVCCGWGWGWLWGFGGVSWKQGVRVGVGVGMLVVGFELL